MELERICYDGSSLGVSTSSSDEGKLEKHRDCWVRTNGTVIHTRPWNRFETDTDIETDIEPILQYRFAKPIPILNRYRY